MPNTNCLAGIACPNCDSEGPFDIEGKATFRVTDDGTDEHEGVEWDNSSHIECCGCGHRGSVGAFSRDEGQDDAE